MAVKKTTKKRITKNIDKGQVHINASFNNTLITFTDEQGNAISAWLQRLEKEHPVCRSAGMRKGGCRRQRARYPFGRSVRKGTGLGT